MQYVIAVFDVGKTNKKVLIYSRELVVLDSAKKSFDTVIRDGVETEDVGAIEEWFLATLRAFARSYDIRVIAVTTHGATFACIADDGELSVPVVSYTHEPGDDFHDEFYTLAGDKDSLQRETATLELKALINPAQGLYFLKKTYPDAFAKTRAILFYPQFFGYRLTRQVAADYTYVGCHTYLWDFGRDTWSSVAEKLGIVDILPKKIGRSWDVLGRISRETAEKTGLSEDTIVTYGIHDSNASLLPYLIKKTDEDFVLNSTGTWCVAMHPMDTVFFRDDEIGKAVFYNISPLGSPVKTSILLGGLEFETYTDVLKNLDHTEIFPEYNRSIYARLIEDRSIFIVPGVVPGTGMFPNSEAHIVEKGKKYPLEGIRNGSNVPAFLNDYPVAYAALNLSLAIQTKFALESVGATDGVSIYTEGGFRDNPDYNHVLSALMPESPVHLTGIKEATSFGAAMTARLAYENAPLKSLFDAFEIETQRVRTESFDGLDEYVRDFMELV